MSRLYLVDDHRLVRDGLKSLLATAGHSVVGESEHPTVAMAEMARLQPDVLLLDLNLGGRSGFEILDGLRERRLAVRTILLTMSAQPRDVAEGLRLGALGHVLKGAPATELLHAVDQVLAGRRHLSPEVADLALRGLQAQSAAPEVEQLSPREQQILKMVVTGRSSAAIGQVLHLSPKTVDTYRSRLMAKLNVSDVPALVRLAIRLGVIGLDD